MSQIDLQIPHLSGQGIRFRAATSSDVPAIAQCRLTDPGTGPADPRMAAYFDGRHHPQRALPPRAGYLAMAGDHIIGYIAGHRTTRHGCDGELQYLYVSVSYRRQGITSTLLRMLAGWFREQGVCQVCVAVANDSPPEARPFVESAGAVPLRPHWYAWKDIGAAVVSSAVDDAGH